MQFARQAPRRQAIRKRAARPLSADASRKPALIELARFSDEDASLEPVAPHMSFLRRLRASFWMALIAPLLLQAVPASATVPAGPAGAAETTPDDRLTVSKVNGKVFRIKDKGVYVSLERGSAIDVNRPVKVGGKSRADLALRGDGGTLELGPDAQLVLFPAWREGREETLVTALRLDNGYLKITLADAAQARTRFEVAFGRWKAELAPGEYVIEKADDEASVCTIRGEMRMTGTPAWSTASEASRGCLRMVGDTPSQIALKADDWSAVERRRALLPVLAAASRRERNDALAKLEAQYAANPDAGTSAATVAEAPAAISKMPRARGARLTPARPISTTRLESQIKTLDQRIDRQQAELAEALVASVPAPMTPPAPAPAVVAQDVPVAPAAAEGATVATPAPTQAPSRIEANDAPIVAAAEEALTTRPPAAGPAPQPQLQPQLTYAKLISQSAAAAALTPVSIAPPAPAAAAEAESAIPAPAALASEWIVNVATHPTIESAEAQAAQLRAQKFAAGIRRETVRGRSSYRVVIEGLATEQAANDLAKTLVSDLGLRQAWVLRKH